MQEGEPVSLRAGTARQGRQTSPAEGAGCKNFGGPTGAEVTDLEESTGASLTRPHILAAKGR